MQATTIHSDIPHRVHIVLNSFQRKFDSYLRRSCLLACLLRCLGSKWEHYLSTLMWCLPSLCSCREAGHEDIITIHVNGSWGPRFFEATYWSPAPIWVVWNATFIWRVFISEFVCACGMCIQVHKNTKAPAIFDVPKQLEIPMCTVFVSVIHWAWGVQFHVACVHPIACISDVLSSSGAQNIIKYERQYLLWNTPQTTFDSKA